MRHLFFFILLSVCFNLDKTEAKVVTSTYRKYYYIEHELITWMEAVERCRSMRMNLFTVRDQDEFDFLKEIILQRYGKFGYYWMGGRRYDGVYKWLPNYDNITKFFWHENEPNNFENKEECLNTYYDNFEWNDNDCSVKRHYICEGQERYR